MAARELVLMRHGQSTGNVAREEALAVGADLIEVGQRDADVPLTALGREQAGALGEWLGELPPGRRPTATWCSPYVRAQQTADIALAAAGLDLPLRVDERLRDRELGVLDLLTAQGVAARFPQERDRRRWLGKLYYRPPGGESWADLALRLRSALPEILAADGVALVVCHDAVIMLVRYVLEGWDERTLLDTAAATEIANGSVTRLVRDEQSSWAADLFNFVEHIREQDAAVTTSADDHATHPA
jgi:broad specificity phosphatase PhoE